MFMEFTPFAYDCGIDLEQSLCQASIVHLARFQPRPLSIFIPAFVIIELSRKKPFVNLHLLAQRSAKLRTEENRSLPRSSIRRSRPAPKCSFTVAENPAASGLCGS
jgi:hypothetical protein